jgi:hypothetical protein
MVEEFGSGLTLDEDFDLRVDQAGDLDTESGIEELSKDLSLQLSFSLRVYLGERASENLKAEVKNTTKNVVELDTRVRRFREERSEVFFSGRGTETIELTVPIITENNESYELVVEVN